MPKGSAKPKFDGGWDVGRLQSYSDFLVESWDSYLLYYENYINVTIIVMFGYYRKRAIPCLYYVQLVSQ